MTSFHPIRIGLATGPALEDLGMKHRVIFVVALAVFIVAFPRTLDASTYPVMCHGSALNNCS